MANDLPRILIVDDDAEVADILSDTLKLLNYEVETHLKAKAALEAFRGAPERYSLIITDYGMPELKGDQFAHAIHTINPQVPIILSTGADGMKHRSIAGISEVLTKPFTLSDILHAIERAVPTGAAGK